MHGSDTTRLATGPMVSIERNEQRHLGGFIERLDAHGMPTGGFNFDNCHRNAMLASSHSRHILPHAMKTGTTIVGVQFKDGVVLGADTRATGDDTVCDKSCEKIHYIAPNIYCCGAGTAADTEAVTAMVGRQLDLLRLTLGRESRVVTAVTKIKQHLFRYQGHVSAALILGGVDVDGPHLYEIYPHGCTSVLSYSTMGSGSLAAMSVLENEYKDDLTEEEAKALVHKAILAGIFNDLGSGSSVDLRVLRKDYTQYYRRVDNPNEVAPLRAMVKHSARKDFPKGTTAVAKTDIREFVNIATHVTFTSPEADAAAAAAVAAGGGGGGGSA